MVSSETKAVATLIGTVALTAFVVTLAIQFGIVLMWLIAAIAGIFAVRFGVMPIAEKGIEIYLRMKRDSRSFVLASADENGNYSLPLDARTGRLITYIPSGNGQRQIAKPRMDYIEAEPAQTLQIEAPKLSNEIIPFTQQLQSGLTSYGEDTSVFGYDLATSEPLRVPLFQKQDNFVNSLFVIGEQGNGKSVVGTYISALTVNHGGYLLVIDPDANEDQSLSNRLGPLKDYLLCEVADTPDKAERVLKMADNEIKKPGEYPVLFLVDEFSMLMRAKKLGGEWKEVADLVASQVENWATRGRKRNRRVVVFGQISNASRTGGTELRDVCAYLVFNTSVKKAERVLSDAHDEDIADLAPMLRPGCAIVSPARSSETYTLRFPLPDEKSLQIIVETRRNIDEDLANSEHVQERFTDELNQGSRTFTEPHLNIDELALQADVRKVRTLIVNHTQDEIIYMLWGARKGGTQRYQEARKRYQAIKAFIETGEWPVASEEQAQ